MELAVQTPKWSEVQIRQMTAAERIQALRVSLMSMTEGVLLASQIVKVMDANEEEIPSIVPTRLVAGLRRIAEGRMLPEVMVHFREDIPLRDTIGRLPMVDQKRLLAGDTVPVCTPESEVNGNVTYGLRQLPPEALTPTLRRQVFDYDRIRDQAEQIAWLKAEQQLEIKKAQNPTRAGLRIDRRRRGLWIGQWFYREDEIAEALAGLKTGDTK